MDLGASVEGVRTGQAGRLEDVAPLDLLQSLGIYRRPGHVRFFHPHGESQLWFEAGQIVDAQSGALRGAAAVYRIVTHEHGEFRVEVTGLGHPRAIETSASALVFEAARRLDEGQRLRARLAPDDHVLACQGTAWSIPGATEALVCTAERFASGATLGEVLEQSELGELETLQRVAELVDAGRLVPTGRVREPAYLHGSLGAPWPAQYAHEEALPVAASLPTLDYDGTPPPRRRRGWILAAMGTLAVALVTVGVMRREAEDEPTATEPLVVTARPLAVVDAAAAAAVPRDEPAASHATTAARPPLAAPPTEALSPPRSKAPARGSRASRPQARSRPATPPGRADAAAGPAPTVEDPSALIVQARRAYAAGQGATAYRLAARSQQLRESGDAAEAMALAACLLRQPAQAAEALRGVPLLRRGHVRAQCKQAHGVRLKLARGGR